MVDEKRYEEERRRIMEKYGVKEKQTSPQTSRYLEYRKQEKLREEMKFHPERFVQKEPTPVHVESEPQTELEEKQPEKKKSWFSRLLGN